MARVVSVNLGARRPSPRRGGHATGIDKRPVAGPVMVHAQAPRGIGQSGLAGDAVCDLRHHGGTDQAVYAYAREDLDRWQDTLGRPLAPGAFGENLTTLGVDLANARLGERWRIGAAVVLEVSSPRIPCATFAAFMGERGWVRRFTREGRSGAYLRVVVEGAVRAGDAIEIVHRPVHAVTIERAFRALTTEPALLPGLLDAGNSLSAAERAPIEACLRRQAPSTGPARDGA